MLESADIIEEQAKVITSVYDKVLEVYKALTETNDKQDNKVAKRMLTRTHLVSIIPTVAKQIENETWNAQQFTAWIRYFFAGKKSATISDKYNSASRSSSGKPESIRTRLEVVKEDFTEFVLNYKEEQNNDKAEQKPEPKGTFTQIMSALNEIEQQEQQTNEPEQTNSEQFDNEVTEQITINQEPQTA
jgi:hypothetical protein